MVNSIEIACAVGRGKNYSVLDIVNALEEAWGKKMNKKIKIEKCKSSVKILKTI